MVLHVEPAGGQAILGCEIELQQALVNLVRNAIAATPGGTVILRARAEDDQTQLEVIDDGSAPAAGAGMGLGLIIARTIVEAHGGLLRSAVLTPGGSCYALSLPRPDPA